MGYLHAYDTSVADSVVVVAAAAAAATAAAAAEQSLVRSIERNSSHVFRALLPPKACSGYDLRP